MTQQQSSGRGGARAGAGRKPGSLNTLSKAAREAAARTGRLPHEILLDIARGLPIQTMKADESGELVPEYHPVGPDEVLDAAKAGAPYYAPKISTIEVTKAVDDGTLNELIGRFAAEAGLSLVAGGEGASTAGDAEQTPAGPAAGVRTRRRLLD